MERKLLGSLESSAGSGDVTAASQTKKRSLPNALIGLLCLIPLAQLVWRGFYDRLGANPIERITLTTGTWTLTLLLATLSITPLRILARQTWLGRIRRTIGLFAFFYAVLHFVTYIWLDKFFDFPEMAKDIVRRPFITAGFFAFVLLIPLAVTSTSGSFRRLGERNWRRLHRLVYISAGSAVIHFWWKVKADTRRPAIYAGILIVLLACRLLFRLRMPAARSRLLSLWRIPRR